MRIINILTHPLSIPVYTYALFLEMERQSYIIEMGQLIMLLLQCAILGLISMYVIDISRNYGQRSPISHPTPIRRHKIIAATALTLVYTALAIIIKVCVPFYTWGAHLTSIIFILPTWMIMAPKPLMGSSYTGALSGFAITIGYKTSTDTFWPFVISLLLLTLHAYINTQQHDTPLAKQLYAYSVGILQSILIMFIFA